MTEKLDLPPYHEAGKLLGLCQFNGVVYAAFENGPYFIENGVLRRVPFQVEPIPQKVEIPPKGKKNENAKG